MMTHDPQAALNDDDDAVDALFQTMPPPVVPDHFAADVLAVHDRRRRRRRFIGWSAGISAALSLLVVAARPADVHVEIVAQQQRTESLGADATAVFEPGAQATVAVDAGLFDDDVIVAQQSGRVFYRVDRGSSFSVRTVAGDVRVHGTCFFVDLQPSTHAEHLMSDSRSNPSLRTLATATIGAAVGAILTVTVVEGTVSVHNPAGTVTASAGHTVTATPTTAPQLDLPPKAATPSVRGDDARLPDIATTVVELQAQNQQLRLKLQKAEEELALTDEVRTAEQGVALPFPADLPARFAADALQKAFEAALSEAGIEGGVLEVDCAEFPCVVFGQVSTRDDMDKLRRTQAFAPYSDDANSTSVWTATRDKDGTKVLESYFGVALLPQGDKPADVQQKRLQRRVQEGYEHKYAPPHAE